MAIVGAFAIPHPPLIIPGVGGNQRNQIKDTVAACQEVGRRVAELAPETIVISSPHSIMYRDYLHISPGHHARGSFAQYGAPEARYEADYDTQFVSALCRAARKDGLAAGTAGQREAALDHGTMIALHFICQHFQGFKVVRMGISGLTPADHYRLGQLVADVADELGRRVVYVASGDLSHKLLAEGPYGFAPEGPEFDRLVCDTFASGDFLGLLTIDPGFAERAAECGLRSFQIMAGALDRTPVSPELLSHEGPFGVGYGVAAFAVTGARGEAPERDFAEKYAAWHAHDMAKRKDAESAWVRLARMSLETFVRTGRRVTGADAVATLRTDTPHDPAWDEICDTQAGCFVSLKVAGQLRGCIGTIAPTRESLADEICANAISAGTNDPRFDAVEEDELSELVYDVDVLGEAEGITSTSELDPSRFGVIVTASGGRRGLLLPDLDGVDTVEEQVSIAAQKGGIDLRRDKVSLARFEVVRHL